MITIIMGGFSAMKVYIDNALAKTIETGSWEIKNGIPTKTVRHTFNVCHFPFSVS